MMTIKFSKDFIAIGRSIEGMRRKKPSEYLPCFKLRKLGGFRGHLLS